MPPGPGRTSGDRCGDRCGNRCGEPAEGVPVVKRAVQISISGMPSYTGTRGVVWGGSNHLSARPQPKMSDHRFYFYFLAFVWSSASFRDVLLNGNRRARKKRTGARGHPPEEVGAELYFGSSAPFRDFSPNR